MNAASSQVLRIVEPSAPEIGVGRGSGPAAPARAPEMVIDALIDRHDVGYLIRRHGWTALAFPLAGLLAAALWLVLQTPLFKSSAVVMVDPSFETILQYEKVDGGAGDPDVMGLRSLEEAIISQTVILRVVDALGLRDAPGFLPDRLASKANLSDAELVGYLRKKRISAALRPETRLIEISVLDPDPDRAKRIAAALTSEFETLVSERRQEEVAADRERIEAKAESARQAAQVAEEELKAFRESHPTLPLEQDHGLFAAQLTKLGNDLSEVQGERRRLESQHHALAALGDEAAPLEIVELASYRDLPHVSELLNALAAARSNFEVVRQRYMEKHPTYLSAQTELEKREAELDMLSQQIVDALEASRRSAAIREEALTAELEALVGDIGNVKSISSQFRALFQQTEKHWALHQALQDRLRDTEVSGQLSSRVTTVVSDPLLPFKKAKPNVLLTLGVGGGTGSLLAAAFLACIVLQGLPFSHAKQIEQRLGCPVLADWTGPEESRALPTRLLQHLAAHPAAAVHVSGPGVSPAAAEAAARRLAELSSDYGRRTLLIRVRADDADGEVIPTVNPNLDLMDLSVRVVNSTRKFSAGIEQFKGTYDTIFIESCGLGDPATAQLLSCLTDLDIVLAVRDETRRDDVEEHLGAISALDPSTVAFVLVDAETGSDAEEVVDEPEEADPFKPEPAEEAKEV